MHSLSLFELNEHLRRVIALNLPDALWVRAEIGQISVSRGHYYLSLLEKDPFQDEIIAQTEAVIWQKNAAVLSKNLGELLPIMLQPGQQILMKACATFHERFGFKLQIEDLDRSYSEGQWKMQREMILQRLINEKLLYKNKSHSLPPVIQRIAIVSSSQAAGYIDFLSQITNNSLGYVFHLTLFEAAMQGQFAATEVCQQLAKIATLKADFDCTIIIRGGGSKLDLQTFDHYEIGKAIAQHPIPVFTGIGHEIDETIADLLAFLPLKTPTAVAAHFLEHNAAFEFTLSNLYADLNKKIAEIVQNQHYILQSKKHSLQTAAQNVIREKSLALFHLNELLPRIAKFKIDLEKQYIFNKEKAFQFISPLNILEKGYAKISQNEKQIARKAAIDADLPIKIYFKDGYLDAEIIKKNKHEQGK